MQISVCFFSVHCFFVCECCAVRRDSLIVLHGECAFVCAAYTRSLLPALPLIAFFSRVLRKYTRFFSRRLCHHSWRWELSVISSQTRIVSHWKMTPLLNRLMVHFFLVVLNTVYSLCCALPVGWWCLFFVVFFFFSVRVLLIRACMWEMYARPCRWNFHTENFWIFLKKFIWIIVVVKTVIASVLRKMHSKIHTEPRGSSTS